MSKNTKHQELFDRAQNAGRVAGNRITPTPMRVVEHKNPFDDNNPIVQEFPVVMGGVCGFAWVNIRPGNSSFARWMVKNNMASKAYKGGVDIWISDHGQSYERKTANASAMARVLRDAGIKAYSMNRLD